MIYENPIIFNKLIRTDNKKIYLKKNIISDESSRPTIEGPGLESQRS